MYNYINFKKYAVRYDETGKSFALYHEELGTILKDIRITVRTKDLNNVIGFVHLADFAQSTSALEKHFASNCLAITFSGCNDLIGSMTVRIAPDAKKVTLSIDANPEREFIYTVEGTSCLGSDQKNSVYSMRRDRLNTHLRAALGPATSPYDNMLFDKETDTALIFSGAEKTGLRFDYEKNAYTFCISFPGDARKCFSVCVEQNIYEKNYDVHYAPAMKRGGATRPPVGWMTWYAVMFASGEQTVLENATIQAEKLKDFGADTIWVDWEWYHTGFDHTEPDCDTFHPLRSLYPNGIDHTAQGIRKLGFMPAVWIGASHETREIDFIREHPESVLVQRTSWCGPYWYDPTSPAYLKEYIPKVFQMLVDWGYAAIKWDALPRALDYYDMYHDRFADPTVSTEQAMRNVIKAARQTVGEDIYLLSCHGEAVRDITMYADIFDAARIGADIFSWQEFRTNCVDRLMEFYPMHNVLQLLDPDNVVIREEFNTITQARSRASLVCLAGTPITFGDDLRKLPEERFEILRRTVPSLDAHTMDFTVAQEQGDFVTLDLCISTPWESYKVLDVFNTAQCPAKQTLDLQECELEKGTEYLIFDFWNKKFLGKCMDYVDLEFEACESKILAVRRYEAIPQIVSTNRHVTQGAVELREVRWADNTLKFTAEVVKNDLYRVYIHVPEGFRAPVVLEPVKGSLYTWSVLPEETGTIQVTLEF